MAPTNIMHLWFLANLALYTLVFWPLYPLRRRVPGPPLPLPAAIATATAVVAVLTKPWGEAIVGDGYHLWWYAGFFRAVARGVPDLRLPLPGHDRRPRAARAGPLALAA